jgi:ABC-type multidrug transport system ATPase subunit
MFSVSGGERKRVSLLEILTTNPVVVSWDNCGFRVSLSADR